jgi:hypothetical protein
MDRKEYIKKQCLKYGTYAGYKKTIHKCDGTRFKWIIRYIDQFGSSLEMYETLDEAVYDFRALEKATSYEPV